MAFCDISLFTCAVSFSSNHDKISTDLVLGLRRCCKEATGTSAGSWGSRWRSLASLTKLQVSYRRTGCKALVKLLLFQKHRGLQANRDGNVMCRHVHPGLQTGCVFIHKDFGVSVLHIHDCALPASAFACRASSPPLPGMPDHRYLLIYLQTFHLHFLFHTNTYTHTHNIHS